MPSKFTITLGLICILGYVEPVVACSYEAQPLTTLLPSVNVAFVGKVEFSEGDKSRGSMAKFDVVLPVKGIDRTGLHYDVMSEASSCGFRFAKGETWLIMGELRHVGLSTDMPHGSLLLTNEDEKPICNSWRAVMALNDKVASIAPRVCDLQ